jgi:putative RecB family exonuclease
MAGYSHSSLSTFRNCPLQYKLKYIDRIRVPETDSVEAFLGSRVHETLEMLYRRVILSKITNLDELLKFFEENWRKHWHPDVCIRKSGLSEEDYFNTGVRALSDYYRRHYPFNSSRTLAVEKRLTFSIAGKYPFVGFIDRLDSAGDGIYEIHDYKTSATLPDEEYFEYDTQLALYHIGLRQHYSDAGRVRLIWHYLVFDREFSVEKEKDELARIESETATLIEEIEGTTEFLPKESALCDWCDYPPYCPARKHIVMTEDMTPDEFMKEDGVKLVTRYSEVKAELDRLQAEMEILKEKLIRYAETNECSSIQGSDHIVKISRRNVYRYSDLDEEGRRMLEDILRDTGIWDDVTTLNYQKLNKVVSSMKPDDDRARRIKAMLSEGTDVRLSLRRGKRED